MKKAVILICFILSFSIISDISYASARRDFGKIEELYLREDYIGAQKKIDRYLKENRGGRQRRKVKEYKDAIERKLCLLEADKQNIEIANKTIVVEEEDYIREPEYYIVQVGAFSSYKNASKQARLVKRKGFDVILLKITDSNGIIYKVRAGKFQNENNAKKLVRKLRLRGFNADIVEE